MALFAFSANQDTVNQRPRNTMKTNMTTTVDDTAHVPDSIGDRDEQPDAVPRAADAEDRAPDEDGYGYGV